MESAVQDRVSYSFGWEWAPSAGSRARINIGPYSDFKIGEDEFISYLALCGYTPPKWWQYWRWSERRLSRDRRAALDAALKEYEG